MTAPDEPTRTARAAATAVTAAGLALVLLDTRTVVPAALVGIGGAAALGLAVQAATAGGTRRLVAAVATPYVAVAVVVGGLAAWLSPLWSSQAGAGLKAAAVTAPVLIGQAAVVVGCLLAATGVALGARGSCDRETLATYYWLAVRTGAIPLVTALVLAGGGVLSAIAAGRGLGLWGLGAGLVGWLVAPDPGSLHVASFLLVVAVAAGAVGTAVRALPVAELLSDTGLGESRDDRLKTVRLWLLLAAVLALFASPVGLYLDLLFRRPPVLAEVVGPSLATVVTVVTGSELLRGPLVALTVLALLAAAGAGLVRRLAGQAPAAGPDWTAPAISGGALTVLGFGAGGPIVGVLVELLAGRLPEASAGSVRDAAGGVVGFYGPGTVLAGLLAGAVLVVAFLVLAIRVALFAGYLPERAGGYALAAAGLVIASAFAGTLGAPAWQVYVGLAAGLFVWDAGEFAATLGREVGRAATTRETELVHTGASLPVGVAGVGAAFGVKTLLTGWHASSPVAVLGLFGALAGIVLLVAALR